MKIKDEYTNFSEKIIWILTVILFALFYILDTNPNISYILFGVTILIFILSAYDSKGKIRIKITSFQVLVFMFSLFCIISSIWSYSATLAIEKGVTIFEILVCMSLLYLHYSKYKSIDGLIKAVMYGGGIVSIYTFYYYGIKNVFNAVVTGIRLDSGFANINVVGMSCTLSIIIAIFYAINDKVGPYLLLIIPEIIVVAASGSRKALIMLVLGILLVIVTRVTTKNIFKTVIKTIIICVCIYYIAPYFLSLFSGINERMQGIFALITGQGRIDHSTIVRQEMIHTGIEQFKKTPILGIGIGNARFLNIGGYYYLHNNYVELLTCGGILGFILYYSIYLVVIINLIKYKLFSNKISIIVFIMIINFLVMDYGAVSYYSKTTYFYLMIFYLHISNIKKQDKLNKEHINYEK
ncbi:MAG: O-antigen ligase family protein [Clostridium perfringens]